MKKVALVLLIGSILVGCGSTDSGSTTSDAAATSATTIAAEPPSSTTTTVVEPPTTSTTTTTTTMPDTTPPELVVTVPADGSTVADAQVTFQGTVEPGVQGVWAAPSYEAVIDGDGNWEVVVDLSSGHNDVVLFTLDQAANETVVEMSITYTAPMPCGGMEVQAEHVSAFPVGAKDWCGGWGYIESINSNELVFDLIQVNLNVAGDESQGWSFVNENPMLRYLPLSSSIEVRACPPAPGGATPGVCGSPWVGPETWEFSLWTVSELGTFVASGDELWRVLVDPVAGEVVWVEQWWTP